MNLATHYRGPHVKGSVMSERDIYLSAEPIDGISAGHYMDLNIALFRLMRDKELSRITVTEVAEEAGISRKTFYNYFKNVDDLARYVLLGIVKPIE